MVSKETILKNYKKNYRPSFLLGWAGFLTYAELEKTDQPEIFDFLKDIKKCKTTEEWDAQVIKYTEENLKKYFHTQLHKYLNADEADYMFEMHSMYVDDIVELLKLLEDKSFKKPKVKSIEEAKDFYRQVMTKYQFS